MELLRQCSKNNSLLLTITLAGDPSLGSRLGKTRHNYSRHGRCPEIPEILKFVLKCPEINVCPEILTNVLKFKKKTKLHSSASAGNCISA